MIIHKADKGYHGSNWPEQLGTAMYINHDIRIVSSPDDFPITVSGDPRATTS